MAEVWKSQARGRPNRQKELGPYPPPSLTHCSFLPALLPGHPRSQRNQMCVLGHLSTEHRQTLRIHFPHNSWSSCSGKEVWGGSLLVPFGKTEAEMPLRGRDPQRRVKRETGRWSLPANSRTSRELLFSLEMSQKVCLSLTLESC